MKVKVELQADKLKEKLGIQNEDGNSIVEKINNLDSESEKIDAKHIKNLPTPVGGVAGVRKITAGAGISTQETKPGQITISSTGSSGFEAILKNVNNYPVALTYSGTNLSTKTFTWPTGDIVATYTYSGSNITQITLSGAVPSGVSTTKTITYTGSNPTSVTYS